MAQYKNEDNVLMMFNRFYHMCKTREQRILVLDMKQAFLETPTADVVPKSESEFDSIPVEVAQVLRDKAVEKAKVEIARGIFEEIENVINNELQNNCKVLPQFEFSNELWNKMSGRIEALKEICDFIAELKKKYTEGEG